MILVRRVVAASLAAVALVGLGAVPALADDPVELAQAAESARGRLVDPEGEPMSGVAIRVESADGAFTEQAVSDADGAWEIAVPGPGAYQVTLDPATLPDGVGLRDPERTTLDVDVRSGQQRTILFATGEATAAASVGSRVFSRIAAGIQFGLIIAITAIGLSLIFGTTGLVNFSHGELVTFGAIVAWFLNAPPPLGADLPLIVAAVIATVATAALGGGIERGLWRPLRRRRTGLIQMLVISIGLMLAMRNALQLWFGGRSLPYFDYTIQSSLQLGPVQITPRDLTVIALAAVTLVGVATMLRTTRIGKAMRAVSDNRDLAESSGIDVQQVILIIWVLGAGLAGFGGVLAATVENVSFLLGFRLLLLMFAGIILGGLGTAYGAMVGSIVIGLVTELSTLWFSPELKFVWALLVLILILLVRPQGILGQRERIG